MNNSQLILSLDVTLRNVLQQPNVDNIRSCFSLIRQCHQRRVENENECNDDSLYIPATLLLRQFTRFQMPATFDELLTQFRSLFELIPIRSGKVLDDILCLTSLVLTKRVMISNDEVQQRLFVQFLRAFFRSIKSDAPLFYEHFLANFNQNLPIIGHLVSCLLQLFERTGSLDYRLDIIDTLWTFVYVEKDGQNSAIIGQIVACFLPGILKTFAQDLGSVHQRLIEATLIFLSYIVRISVCLTSKFDSNAMKEELQSLVVERNEQWLMIVDAHIAPLLQRFTVDYINHESTDVRRALATLMLTILCYCSKWLTISASMALKTVLVIVDQNETIRCLLEKLFDLPIEVLLQPPSQLSLLTYPDEFAYEIVTSSNFTLSNHLLVECQNDLFQLLDQQQMLSSSATFLDRRWRLQLFIGHYTFISRHVNFLFDLETFSQQLLRFIFNTLDFDTLTQSNRSLLNATSSTTVDHDTNQFNSIYKMLQSDVHAEIKRMIQLFLSSRSSFVEFLMEELNVKKKIDDEDGRKLLYLFCIVLDEIPGDTVAHQLISLLSQMIYDDENRKQKRKDRRKKEEPVSNRNLTIYYLLQCTRILRLAHRTEFLIDYVPLLLLCHSSKYTIVHQTSLLCLNSLSSNTTVFLATHIEYIVDRSLRQLQTSSFDGYFILIELIKLGNTSVVNLPIMTHVIEQFLLELSCLPPVECIELTFEFLKIFCQQVIDIVDEKTIQSVPQQSSSLIDFALELQRQYTPILSEESSSQMDDEEKKEADPPPHPWRAMLVSIVDVFQHFISHSNNHIRSYVLDAFPSLARLLSTIDENLFLPLVHKLWPGLIRRLHDSDFNIRIRCLTTIQCLCQICSDFVDRRIRQDILPVLIQQLDNNRLISVSHALEYRYMKHLLNQIGMIVDAITPNTPDIERLILILLRYLQVEPLANSAYEQLTCLTRKYSDLIWLTLILYDENEDERKCYFPKMKIYKPEPTISIDSKWKSDLVACCQ